MPLRYIRKKLTAENALSVAVATTAVTRELANTLQFPPASAAAGILLLIFKTIQEIQENRTECYRLASRCLTLLTDLKDAMEGRWEDAPPSLLRSLAKFEQTLQNIYDDLKRFAEHKWKKRFTKKNSIESAIAEYNIQLDDAARSFQITTLIDIHYVIGDGRNKRSPRPEFQESFPLVTAAPGELCESPTSGGSMDSSFSDVELISTNERSSTDEFTIVSEPSVDSITLDIAAALPAAVTADRNISNKDWLNQALMAHDDCGFRRYHQSEVLRKGSRSRIKTGWWTGAQEVNVEGRQLVLIPYHGSDVSAAKRWIRDVKVLQNVYHPSLPQMVGYSGTDAPTPFILLANVQTRLPQAMVLDAIGNSSLLLCARLLIRFYRDIFDSALYLQRQLDLSESKLQDYVENASFRIDAQDTMIMGLPPPEVDRWNSYRNYGLTHSIREVFIKILPNRGYARRPYDSKDITDIEVQTKINHLAVLTKALLPSSDNYAQVSQRLEDVLGGGDEDEDEDEELTLPLIRMQAIKANAHEHTWDNNFVPAYTYTVGDLGYIPEGKDFTAFVPLKNFIKDGLVRLDTVQASHGIHLQWDQQLSRQQLQTFPAPCGFSGWPVVIAPGARDNVNIVYECSVASVSAAWQVLLDHGRSIAEDHGVKPEDLMLVTRSGVDIRFVVSDLRPKLPSAQFNAHFQPHGFGFSAPFGAHGMHTPHFGMPTPQPAVLYLFTSPEKDQEAVLSETPVYVPLPPGSARPEVRQCFCGHEGTYGFMNYVQLHAEDFA